MFHWQVTFEENGTPALAWLRRRLPRAPEGYLRRLLAKGRIRRAADPVAPEDRLWEGDRITLPGSRRLAELVKERHRDIHVLLETPAILAVEKPAGLPVHRGADPAEDNLADRVRAFLRARGEPYSADPVHRLDLATTGPVIFGKGRRAKGRLGRLFMENQVEKIYLALVAGLPPSCGRWTGPVRAKGKWRESATTFQVLESLGGWTLVEARPRTGRTHQVRRHFADAGHPLAGDRRYGGPGPEGLHRVFLHCLGLGFTDPWTGRACRISSPVPPDLIEVLDKIGLSPENLETVLQNCMERSLPVTPEVS